MLLSLHRRLYTESARQSACSGARAIVDHPLTRQSRVCGSAGHHPALDLVHVGKDHFEESRELLRGDVHAVMILRAF